MSEENIELATRGMRLFAVIIDALIIVPIMFLIAKTTGFWEQIMPRLASGLPLTMQELIIMFVVGQSLFLILNGLLLAKHGQTIGKKIVGVKIVDTQQKSVGLLKLYFLRYLTFSFISQIPLIGSLINLINILFIFGKEKRCLHDRIAGTVVVKNK